jgi:hypothetical protein
MEPGQEKIDHKQAWFFLQAEIKARATVGESPRDKDPPHAAESHREHATEHLLVFDNYSPSRHEYIWCILFRT